MKEHSNDTDDLVNAIFGTRSEPGAIERLDALEEWRKETDKERTFVKGLLIGMFLMQAGTGAGIIAILRTLGG